MLNEYIKSYKSFFLIPLLLQKLEEKGKCFRSFCEISITLIPKPDEDITRKDNYR